MPANLSELGVGRDRIEEMAQMAIEDPSAGGNPVPMELGSTVELYHRCLEWDG